MAHNIYIAYNAARPTTAKIQPVTTGTSIATLLQIASPSTTQLTILEWGISFDGSAAATPISVSLLSTKTVAATVTAHVAAGIQKYRNPNSPASLVTLGTSASGYTATAEGTITDTIVYDAQQIAPTNQYVKQFPLGREPVLQVSEFLRIRVHAPAAVNALCYVVWEE